MKIPWHVFALGSAAFAALTAILGKMGVSQINSNLATLYRTAVILVFAAALVAARGEWQRPSTVPVRGLAFLVLSGLATGLSWLCYYRALQLAPASRVAPIDKLSVVLVVIFAIAFLGEPLTLKVAAGATLVAAGVLILAI